MTSPSPFEYTVISDRAIVHEPTNTTITFPRAQPWRGNGFSMCWVGPTDTDKVLPSGARYALADVISEARKVMMARALAKAS